MCAPGASQAVSPEPFPELVDDAWASGADPPSAHEELLVTRASARGYKGKGAPPPSPRVALAAPGSVGWRSSCGAAQWGAGHRSARHRFAMSARR